MSWELPAGLPLQAGSLPQKLLPPHSLQVSQPPGLTVFSTSFQAEGPSVTLTPSFMNPTVLLCAPPTPSRPRAWLLALSHHVPLMFLALSFVMLPQNPMSYAQVPPGETYEGDTKVLLYV